MANGHAEALVKEAIVTDMTSGRWIVAGQN